MDCPRCGTPNMTVAKFCRRCGEALARRDVWVLGAMSRKSRRVKAGNLRTGEIVPAEFWWMDDVALIDIGEAFLGAARKFDRDSTIRLTTGEGKKYELVVEGAGVIARFHIKSPYARIELRGPRDAVRQVVHRVVARHGEDFFTAHDGKWARFVENAGVTEAENKTTLLELLS